MVARGSRGAPVGQASNLIVLGKILNAFGDHLASLLTFLEGEIQSRTQPVQFGIVGNGLHSLLEYRNGI